jgi:hypothetical protein
MFSECANPDCKKPFDYRQGRFFRFRKACLVGGWHPNTHCVQHLWLWGSCSEKYALAYQDARGVVMTLQRAELPAEQEFCRLVAVA